MDIRRREQVAAAKKKLEMMQEYITTTLNAAREIRSEINDISIDEWFTEGRAHDEPQYKYWRAIHQAADRLDTSVSMLNRVVSDLENAMSMANMASIALEDARSKIIFKII